MAFRSRHPVDPKPPRSSRGTAGLARYAPEGAHPGSKDLQGGRHQTTTIIHRATRMNSYIVHTLRSIEPDVAGRSTVRVSQSSPPGCRPNHRRWDRCLMSELGRRSSTWLPPRSISQPVDPRERAVAHLRGCCRWASAAGHCSAPPSSSACSRRPSRELSKRDGGATSDPIQSPATVSNALRAADRDQPTPMLEELLPKDGHKVTTEARPDLDSSAPAQPAEPRLEKAGLFAGGVDAREPGGPPLPRLKPPTN